MASRFLAVLFVTIFGFSNAQNTFSNPNYQNPNQFPQSSAQNPSQNPFGNNYGAGPNSMSQGSSSWGQQQQTPFNQQGGQDGDRYQNPQMGNYGAGFGNVPQTTAVRLGTPLRFCTVTNEEHSHCLKMVFDLERNFVRSNEPLQLAGNRGKRQTPSTRFYFECVRAVDKLECMKWIGMDKSIAKVDVVLATPGEAYIGAKDYGLIPLAFEIVGTEQLPFEDQVVAVVRADRGLDSIDQLRGKSACFGPVGDVTWDQVVSYLKMANQIQAPRCNEHYMDSVLKYFGDMCAPYDMHNFTDTENDRYRKMCSLCGGQNCPSLQTITPEYSLNCLVQNTRADIAFMRSSVLSQALLSRTLPDPHLYQVICPRGNVPLPAQGQMGGSTKSLQEWSDCYVSRTPSNVYLTRANADKFSEMGRKLVQIFYAGGGGVGLQNQRNQWLDYFFSGRYNDNQRVTNLYQVLTLPEADMDNYLTGYKPYLEDIVSCQAQGANQTGTAKWCTTSKADQEKCEMMKKAFKAYRLRPELQCDPPVKNSYVCLDKINRNQADLAMIDIGDLVVGGNYFNVIQLAQERYLSQDQYSTGSIIDEPYSVALVKDAGINSLANLRGKRACFSGLWEAHGFMLPIDQLKKAGLVNQGDGGHLEAAQDFFGDSCLPGLADAELNKQNEPKTPKDKLCKQCDGGERGCSRNGDQKYAGQLGALKCLRDGKGDVAFVAHTVLSEIPVEETQNYYLVCPNGNVQQLASFESCNMGQAPGNVIVTNRNKPVQEKRQLAEIVTGASRLFSADIATPYQSNMRSSASSFSSTGLERSRKTYHMFGKRNRTDANLFGSTGLPAQNGGGFQLNPASTGVAWSEGGEYALFGVGAYDLRGFGDVNTTQVGEALQKFRTIGERSDWRTYYENGHGSRLSSTGALFLFLIGLVIPMFLL